MDAPRRTRAAHLPTEFFGVAGARFPVLDVSCAGRRDERSTSQGRGLAKCDVRHFTRFAFEREIFPERVVRDILPT